MVYEARAAAMQAADPDARAALRRLEEGASAALGEMKALVYAVRPKSLDRDGLEASLRDHVEALRRAHGAAIELRAHGELRLTPSPGARAAADRAGGAPQRPAPRAGRAGHGVAGADPGGGAAERARRRARLRRRGAEPDAAHDGPGDDARAGGGRAGRPWSWTPRRAVARTCGSGCAPAGGRVAERARVRVLLVDDHAVVRQGLRAFLQLQPDIEVVGEAGGGEAAVAEVAGGRPDVVLMDLVMPDGDGVDAIRALAAAAPGTRVLVLSSFADDEHVFAAMQAGGGRGVPAQGRRAGRAGRRHPRGPPRPAGAAPRRGGQADAARGRPGGAGR